MLYKGEIFFNKKIGNNLYHLKLVLNKKIKVLPGQFINLKISDSFTPLLRKPFSIFYAKDNFLEIIYKVVGEGTSILSKRKKGEILSFIGPLGNSYPKINKKNIILIGGGTGIASIYFLAKTFKNEKKDFTVICGAENKNSLIYINKFKKFNTFFTTSDGSYGKKGLVTDILQQIKKDNTVIYTCGPKTMFKSIKSIMTKLKNVEIFASFEEYMGCGIGVCLSCVLPVTDKKDGFTYKRICTDGPIFNLKECIL